ncbi:hypothetical protein DPMN_089841 [Dreissena polymorpha]|uniref:Uncharacterized protein n=1 Tax=Dreissena polymorpha TaxID=45954 RepID=A0A9D4QXP2_DREPO|nr:hypothetical protein DPMN_089841 [Dreissena polymorpha]
MDNYKLGQSKRISLIVITVNSCYISSSSKLRQKNCCRKSRLDSDHAEYSGRDFQLQSHHLETPAIRKLI